MTLEELKIKLDVAVYLLPANQFEIYLNAFDDIPNDEDGEKYHPGYSEGDTAENLLRKSKMELGYRVFEDDQD